MKIAIAGGHSKKAPGAVGHLDEYQCDRAYVKQLVKALKSVGHTVVDCSNEMGDQSSELAEEVRLANNSGADLFIAVHFNSGISKDDDATTGTECWYYGDNATGLGYAKALSANVAAALDVRDRGAKSTTSFYVLRKTSMPAVLLEVCFVDDNDDAAAWKSTPWGKLTKAVTDALGGSSKPSVKAGWVQDSKGWWYRNADGTWPNSEWLKLKGSWYWFDSKGYAAQSTCAKVRGRWYAFDSNCKMLTSVDINKGGDMAL